ncbi:hypothetical protein FJT64_016721 [Amphibalanus amphitrite]|uniref:Uncharacterized protein n=1 Tax=Amphibalanus amphitrite TaxID=1232801 RepID=A0A6A4XDI8_AMPAM|nr:hypothetical protein FJT64_016721 [Amphibalanus amphitrite]
MVLRSLGCRLVGNIATYIAGFVVKKALDSVSCSTCQEALLESIRQALDTLQSDNATLADAVEVWMDLEANEILPPHRDAVRRRRSQALGTVHAAANLLDPRYGGQKLPAELRKAAEEWLGPGVLADVILMENKEDPFPRAFFEPAFIARLTPRAWWLGLKKRPVLLKPQQMNSLRCQR